MRIIIEADNQPNTSVSQVVTAPNDLSPAAQQASKNAVDAGAAPSFNAPQSNGNDPLQTPQVGSNVGALSAGAAPPSV